MLGGAPFNVAWALQAFGLEPLFISAVGKDDPGHAIMERMLDWGMARGGLHVDAAHTTGEVQVELVDNEPRYDICSPRAWDAIPDPSICVSGLIYHGSLALRSRMNQVTLRTILERSPAGRFYDVNLRPPHTPFELVKTWMTGAEWVKLNLDELREVLREPKLVFGDHDDAVDELRERYSIRNVLLTAGSDGAAIRGLYGSGLLQPAPRVEQFADTVGAGDSFTAVTLYGILSGWTADEIVDRAGKFAAKVCGLNGATSESREFYQI